MNKKKYPINSIPNEIWNHVSIVLIEEFLTDLAKREPYRIIKKKWEKKLKELK